MYDILQLNDMLVPELRELADQLDLKGYKRLNKQELIYKILDAQALTSNGDKESPKKVKKKSVAAVADEDELPDEKEMETLESEVEVVEEEKELEVVEEEGSSKKSYRRADDLDDFDAIDREPRTRSRDSRDRDQDRDSRDSRDRDRDRDSRDARGRRRDNKSDRDRDCLLYTSPSPRDKRQSRMPSSA